MTLKNAIQEKAFELGFDLCRVTSGDSPASLPRFRAWIDQQNQGEMSYLARNMEKRADLDRILGGVKSVICLGASYALPSLEKEQPHGENQSGNFPGEIARYACFSDYHDVLGERLSCLAEFIQEESGQTARSLWYVDTGPVLERDLAQRAGIGFVGKHTNLINRQFGNWIFLSEILTTISLPADIPEANHCGSCTRCLSACPTNALRGPFQLDARRCISYLTIELKGSIPVELRPLIGNRIFGCDDCLEVCPWNRFAREGRMLGSHVRADLRNRDLLELLSLDEPSFKKRFAGTPVLRAKRKGLLRNVCVALGNVADKSALPALERASQDPEPLISEHARWAAERIKMTP